MHCSKGKIANESWTVGKHTFLHTTSSADTVCCMPHRRATCTIPTSADDSGYSEKLVQLSKISTTSRTELPSSKMLCTTQMLPLLSVTQLSPQSTDRNKLFKYNCLYCLACGNVAGRGPELCSFFGTKPRCWDAVCVVFKFCSVRRFANCCNGKFGLCINFFKPFSVWRQMCITLKVKDRTGCKPRTHSIHRSGFLLFSTCCSISSSILYV